MLVPINEKPFQVDSYGFVTRMEAGKVKVYRVVYKWYEREDGPMYHGLFDLELVDEYYEAESEYDEARLLHAAQQTFETVLKRN